MDIQYIAINWNERLPIFSSERYLKTLSDEYGWIGGFMHNELKFVLPYVSHQKYIFRFLQFQTSVIYLDEALQIDAEKDFLNSMVKFLKGEGVDFILQPPASAIFNTYPDNSLYAPFGSYIIDLGITEEELWSNVHQKHRNVIRKAEKSGIRIESGRENAGIAYDLLVKTMARSNISFYDRVKFDQFINLLDDNVRIYVSFHDDQPQGCAVIPFSGFSAYYRHGGSIEHPFLGSLNLLQWEAIKYFKSLGIRYYDFVGARIEPEKGSKLEGIQRFKSRFGATLKTGYLWKMPLSRSKYALYKSLQSLRDGGKGDIIDQERKPKAHPANV